MIARADPDLVLDVPYHCVACNLVWQPVRISPELFATWHGHNKAQEDQIEKRMDQKVEDMAREIVDAGLHRAD